MNNLTHKLAGAAIAGVVVAANSVDIDAGQLAHKRIILFCHPPS